jgi:catechol 2,3-dioxygenase-like lactoylglutathione lyase family enzyme
MTLNHLALTVADRERSRRFYMETLGLTGHVRDVGVGLLLTTGDGFVLALFDGEPPPGRDDIDFGFALDTPEEVRSFRERLLAAGVTEDTWVDSQVFVSFKFLDPDGYVVEAFWEGLE